MENEYFVLKFSDLTEGAQLRFNKYTGILIPEIMEDLNRPVALYLGAITEVDALPVATYRSPSA